MNVKDGEMHLGYDTVETDYLYTGQEFDDESGLMYYNARYYNPVTGRFISRDSYLGEIGDTLSRSRYVYVKNNPYRYVDPTGNVAYPLSHPQSLGDPDDFRYFFSDANHFTCKSSSIGNICSLPTELKNVFGGSIINDLTVSNLRTYNFSEMRPATFGEQVANRINIAGRTYDHATAYGRYQIFNMFDGFRNLNLSYQEYYSYFDAPLRNQFASNLRSISGSGKEFVNNADFVKSSGLDDVVLNTAASILASPIDSIADVADPYVDTYNKLDDYAGLTVGGLLAAKSGKAGLAVGSASRSINTVDDLINAAGDLKYLTGSGQYQGFIKGKNINEVWKLLTKNGTVRPSGAVELPNGVILNKGVKGRSLPTIDVNRPGKPIIKKRFIN